MVYTASAPASIMLMGEHAVLYGAQALAMTLDCRLHTRLALRTDDTVTIRAMDRYLEGTWKNLPNLQDFPILSAWIKRYQTTLSQGFDLEITSYIPVNKGLGSSAATILTVGAVLMQHKEGTVCHSTLLKQSREILKTVQGSGSGTDIAATLSGGIVHYHMDQGILDTLKAPLPFTLIYVGYKKTTRAVLQLVQQNLEKEPQKYRSLFQSMGQLVPQAYQALKINDLVRLGTLMNAYQGYFRKLNLSNPDLEHIVQNLENDNKIWGAKISGSGLGDCVLGLGETLYKGSFEQLTFPMTTQGLITS